MITQGDKDYQHQNRKSQAEHYKWLTDLNKPFALGFRASTAPHQNIAQTAPPQ